MVVSSYHPALIGILLATAGSLLVSHGAQYSPDFRIQLDDVAYTFSGNNLATDPSTCQSDCVTIKYLTESGFTS